MAEEYKTFKWRWGVLATVALTNITTFTNTTGYFSVAAAAAEYFDADDAKMDLFEIPAAMITHSSSTPKR